MNLGHQKVIDLRDEKGLSLRDEKGTYPLDVGTDFWDT